MRELLLAVDLRHSWVEHPEQCQDLSFHSAERLNSYVELLDMPSVEPIVRRLLAGRQRLVAAHHGNKRRRAGVDVVPNAYPSRSDGWPLPHCTRRLCATRTRGCFVILIVRIAVAVTLALNCEASSAMPSNENVTEAFKLRPDHERRQDQIAGIASAWRSASLDFSSNGLPILRAADERLPSMMVPMPQFVPGAQSLAMRSGVRTDIDDGAVLNPMICASQLRGACIPLRRRRSARSPPARCPPGPRCPTRSRSSSAART